LEVGETAGWETCATGRSVAFGGTVEMRPAFGVACFAACHFGGRLYRDQMKKIGLSLGLFAASLAAASAQVKVEVMLDQDQFLLGESLPVAVRVINRSGQTLRLGKEEGWLTFSIEPQGGSPVAQTGDVPVAGEFVLESSKRATKRVDLAPYFVLNQPGHYDLVATLHIKAWGFEAASSPKGFDIIEGAKLWEQSFGVPNSGGDSNAAPEIRKYVLQEANYLKNQLALYLRVTDANGGKAYRVFPIGRMLSFSRPAAQVDKFSNLHVLYQNGPHSFSYTVFDPSGALLVRQTHDYVNTRPRLQPDAEGNFSVVGGVRRFTSEDLPAPRPATPPETAPPPPKKPDDVPPPNR
jgi:hypothetical protein